MSSYLDEPRLKAIYFHELGFLCADICALLDEVWKTAPPPEPGKEELFHTVPRLSSLIHHALSSGAIVKKLLDDGPQKEKEQEVVAKRRQARAKMLREALPPIDITEISKAAVRNRLEHLDEHLDTASARLSKSGRWSKPRAVLYNMAIPTTQHVFVQDGAPSVLIRFYETSTRRFHHLGESIDLGKVYGEAAAIVAALKERTLMKEDGPRSSITTLDLNRPQAIANRKRNDFRNFVAGRVNRRRK